MKIKSEMAMRNGFSGSTSVYFLSYWTKLPLCSRCVLSVLRGFHGISTKQRQVGLLEESSAIKHAAQHTHARQLGGGGVRVETNPKGNCSSGPLYVLSCSRKRHHLMAFWRTYTAARDAAAATAAFFHPPLIPKRTVLGLVICWNESVCGLQK